MHRVLLDHRDQDHKGLGQEVGHHSLVDMVQGQHYMGVAHLVDTVQNQRYLALGDMEAVEGYKEADSSSN